MLFFYHTCMYCGKGINPERLQALPETKICKECAETSGSDLILPRKVVAMDLETYKDLLGAIRS